MKNSNGNLNFGNRPQSLAFVTLTVAARRESQERVFSKRLKLHGKKEQKRF